jgi:hypothetical protein
MQQAIATDTAPSCASSSANIVNPQALWQAFHAATVSLEDYGDRDADCCPWHDAQCDAITALSNLPSSAETMAFKLKLAFYEMADDAAWAARMIFGAGSVLDRNRLHLASIEQQQVWQCICALRSAGGVA